MSNRRFIAAATPGTARRAIARAMDVPRRADGVPAFLA
jgi:hypothetical protein